MLPDKIAVGFVLLVGGRILAITTTAGKIWGPLLILVGVVYFVWGCMDYAEEKGYSKWLGLLGLFSCIGLLVLILLPRNQKDP